MILKVFLWFACNSDVLKSRFYCGKTTIFKDLHVFWKCWFLSSFYLLFINFGVNLCDIFAHFSCTILFIDFLSFFGPKKMPKMDPKSPQNRSQCVPGRRLASWLHPVIFGHAIFTISDAKMAPKMFKNDPIEPPMVPRTIKISHFPPNGRSGIVLLGVSGRIPSHLLLMV